jgi:tRNA pseudouridine55 synthase
MSHINGIINIDKPSGITSMDVVRKIRSASGVKKVGHGGTLDPIATGVIPVAIGKATRLLEYFLMSNKSYIARIHFGKTTDTFDSEGEIISTKVDPPLDINVIEKTMNSFRGEIEQTPPPFSAIKKNGRRLYELARRGIDTYIEPRNVTVNEIKIINYEPPILDLFIRCGKGFYVRSLANDLGKILGCGGYLNDLKRTSLGNFEISKSILLAKAMSAIENGDTSKIVQPLETCVGNFERVNLSLEETTNIKNGQKIPYTLDSSIEKGSLASAFSPKGDLAAIIMFEDKSREWKPVKVFI